MQNNSPKPNTNIYAFVGVVAIIAISIVGILAYNNSKDSADAKNSSTNSSSNSSLNTMTKENLSDKMTVTDVQKSDTDQSNTDKNLTPETTKPGIYTDYSSNLLANAEKGSVVLFFNASWCPTCRVAVRNINNSLDSIPSDLTILSVDYDDSTDLKRKYGVTYQHTFVKVDKDGDQLKKANNLNTVQEIADFAKN